jgi:hypothetical protein
VTCQATKEGWTKQVEENERLQGIIAELVKILSSQNNNKTNAAISKE